MKLYFINIIKVLAFLSSIYISHLYAVTNKEQVQSHDNAWQLDWVINARALYSGGVGKVLGKVLIVGDSISHANPAHQWPRGGDGRTAEDLSIIQWVYWDTWDFASNTNTAHLSGGYLAAADTSLQRGMTASSGLSSDELLSGMGNGGSAMPAVNASMSAARSTLADGSAYIGNLHIDTLVTAFADAEFAFLMIGTNDISAGRMQADILSDIQAIVGVLQTQNIVVVLCTVPPRVDSSLHTSETASLNSAIRQLAQTLQTPLLDIELEHTLRDATSLTLISSDGIHPAVTNGVVSASSNPYADDGDTASHISGSYTSQSGYLLHGWLRVQKLKELKAFVVDAEPVGVNISVLPSLGVVVVFVGLLVWVGGRRKGF